MRSDKKHALGVLLLLVGIIWILFLLIWMPPLTETLIWLAIRIGYVSIFDSVAVSRTVFYGEWALALGTFSAGLYLNLHHVLRNSEVAN